MQTDSTKTNIRSELRVESKQLYANEIETETNEEDDERNRRRANFIFLYGFWLSAFYYYYYFSIISGEKAVKPYILKRKAYDAKWKQWQNGGSYTIYND